jgi:hypothetical protein
MYVGVPKLRTIEEIERERFEEFVQKRIKQEAKKRRKMEEERQKKVPRSSMGSSSSQKSFKSTISKSWDRISSLFNKKPK